MEALLLVRRFETGVVRETVAGVVLVNREEKS